MWKLIEKSKKSVLYAQYIDSAHYVWNDNNKGIVWPLL